MMKPLSNDDRSLKSTARSTPSYQVDMNSPLQPTISRHVGTIVMAISSNSLA